MVAGADPKKTASNKWDPTQYLKFSDHRLRPALELLDRVSLSAPAVVFDLGCGAGEPTRLIARRWPSADVYGVDNSKEMLEKAAAETGRVRWVEADIRTWSPERPADLIYSNASLHWIEDHQQLLPRLVSYLKPGGCLAVQMPLSWGAPSHRLMRETLANGSPGGKPLGSDVLRQAAARKWVLDAQEYYAILAGCVTSLDIWETEYLQVLEGEDAVLEWVKGTGLRPVLNGLEDGEREIFLAEYARRLRAAYPARADGKTLYPFRRLFIIAIT
jgi:trans-aconitate 2-methyltransferase